MAFKRQCLCSLALDRTSIMCLLNGNKFLTIILNWFVWDLCFYLPPFSSPSYGAQHPIRCVVLQIFFIFSSIANAWIVITYGGNEKLFLAWRWVTTIPCSDYCSTNVEYKWDTQTNSWSGKHLKICMKRIPAWPLFYS